MNRGISRETMLFALPTALKTDASTEALADVSAEILESRVAEIDRLRIISNIDSLEEPLVAILAQDFKVDWWDPCYTLEEKRRTVKSSWKVHKLLGTKAAVELGLRAIYPDSRAEPWFEYGGEPYHFRIHADLSGQMLAENKPTRVMELVRYYKSLRDHLDEIRYTIEAKKPAVLGLGTGMGSNTAIGIREGRDVFYFRSTLHPEEAMGANANVGVPEGRDVFDFRSALYPAETMGTRTRMPVPEDVAAPNRVSILRTGGSFVMTAPVIFPTEEG